jgi:putative ABC transport system permease protein
VGVLTTLLFTLPPLLDIRGVRPVLILRRAVEESDDPFVSAVFRKLRKNGAQIGAAVLILAGLAAIAATLSDSAVVGGVFSLGLVTVLAVLLGASALVLAGLKWFLGRTRLSLPSALRHGLANLYRPGNPSAALLAALGLGVMQIMTVYFVQQAVVRELHVTSAPNLPNVFLVDITPKEIDGVRALIKAQPSVTVPAEMLPVVSSRIVEIDGVAADRAKLKNFPKRMLQTISLTWASTAPPGTSAVAGKWWQPGEKAVVVAVNERDAERLGVKVGSHITFAAQDSRFTATVVALTKADGQHAYSRASFILPPAALAGLPVVWYGGVHADPARVGELQRALYNAYPTVTVINVAQALETVRSVVIQITYVIQFLAAFSIFAGIIILASSIAGTRYRRIREVVVLKTLGATRRRIATIFSIEFAVLGLVAGVVGITFANLIARVLLHRMDVIFHWQWGWSATALVGTAALTVVTGWAASHRILGQKPLEVLREE